MRRRSRHTRGKTLATRGSRAYINARLYRQAGRYRSGQTGRTVNPLAYAFVGSNPTLPIFARSESYPFFFPPLRLLPRDLPPLFFADDLDERADFFPRLLLLVDFLPPDFFPRAAEPFAFPFDFFRAGAFDFLPPFFAPPRFLRFRLALGFWLCLRRDCLDDFFGGWRNRTLSRGTADRRPNHTPQ